MLAVECECNVDMESNYLKQLKLINWFNTFYSLCDIVPLSRLL